MQSSEFQINKRSEKPRAPQFAAVLAALLLFSLIVAALPALLYNPLMARIDSLNQRITSLDSKVNQLASDVGAVKGEVAALKAGLENTTRSFSLLLNESRRKAEALQGESPQTPPLFAARKRITVPIVAVSSRGGVGVVGNLTMSLVPGNGHILIDTNPFLETDLQYYSSLAISYAKLYTGKMAEDVDFVLSFNIQGRVVGGGSASAATAVAAIALLQDKQLRKGVVLTGVLRPDGSIGQVGGVLEKAYAAAQSGFSTFLVPRGQSRITYYEKKVRKEPAFPGFYLYNTYYVPRAVDLSKEAEKEWGLKVREVSTVDEALALMVEG